MNLEEEFWRDHEEEFLGDPKRDFLPRLIQSKIREPYLEKLQSKYQVSPDFELEISLETDQAYNPPLSKLTLYKEYFLTGLRLPLFPFFVELFRAISFSPCAVMPNTWWFICSFLVVYVLAKVYPIILLFRAFFSFGKHRRYYGW